MRFNAIDPTSMKRGDNPTLKRAIVYILLAISLLALLETAVFLYREQSIAGYRLGIEGGAVSESEIDALCSNKLHLHDRLKSDHDAIASEAKLIDKLRRLSEMRGRFHVAVLTSIVMLLSALLWLQRRKFD